MTEFNLTNSSNLFKIKYLKLSDNVYNSFNVMLGRVKKDYNFVGRQMFQPVPQSFAGGVGSGSLPTANIGTVEDAIITSKKMYATVAIDREAIKAAGTDEGSFVRQTKYSVQKTVESWMRNMSRTLFHDGTGSLSNGDGSTNVTGAGTSGNPYVVVMGTAWKEANWEERDFVSYDTETTLLEVQAVFPATKTVHLVGTSAGLAVLAGAGPVPVGKYFYMQGSANNDPLGLKILKQTTSTLYTVPVGRRWQGNYVAAGGAGLTTDMMNKDMLDIEKKCGKAPNLIVTSYTQYRKLLNLMEDHKRYSLPARADNLKALVSFSGIEFMSSMGPVAVFPERFCGDDEIYYLNDEYITIYHRPGFGWFDDDGTVFLRSASSDQYEARYGGYLETYIVPPFHGVRDGLAV